MFEEKEVGDIVDGSRADPITAAKTRKKKKDNTVTSKIIKQGVNGDLLHHHRWRKTSPEILGDTPSRLLASWPRSSIFHLQKMAELSKSCQASRI